MPSDVTLDGATVVLVIGMSVGTYATKAGGVWLLERVSVPERVQAGLEVLPGAIVVAIVAPKLVQGGPAEWVGAAVVLTLAWRTGSLLLSLVGGVGTVVLIGAIA